MGGIHKKRENIPTEVHLKSDWLLGFGVIVLSFYFSFGIFVLL